MGFTGCTRIGCWCKACVPPSWLQELVLDTTALSEAQHAHTHKTVELQSQIRKHSEANALIAVSSAFM